MGIEWEEPRNGPMDSGNEKDCCPMVAAVRSMKKRKFRLARRYAAMSARLIVARFAA